MLKNKILIIGTGGHSIISTSILDNDNANYTKLRFKLPLNKKNLIDNKKKFQSFFDKNCNFKISIFIAIGFNYHRKIISEFLDSNFKTFFNYLTIISKQSNISKNVKIGKGSIIMPGVSINTDSVIGKHSIINTNSSLDHHNNIGNFVSVAPGVNTGGYVKVRSGSHLGIGSNIKHNIIINNNSIIGAGSYVNINCKSNCIYYGLPIKFIRKRKVDESYL